MSFSRRQLVKSVFKEFFQESSFMHGAALAYYSLLALVPLLYLGITFFGSFVGHDTMVEIIGNLLSEQIGVQDISGILGFLDELDLSHGSPVLQVLGAFALLLSATAIINSIRRSLNEFYDLERRGGTTKKKIVRGLVFRLISMLFITGVALVIIVFYFAEMIFLSLGNDLFENYAMLNWMFSGLARHGVPILANVIIFSFIFKYLHDGKVKWRRAIEGALLTSLFLYIGQLIIKFYLLNYFFGASGGVAGTMLVILVWVYYSSQIIFLGAKFINVKSRLLGEPVEVRD